MDIRILEDGSKIYPYNRNQLKFDYPNTSFRDVISDECAATYGIFPVADIELPNYDPKTEKIVEEDPVETNDGWKKVISISKLTQEEINANLNNSINQAKSLLISPNSPLSISLDGNKLTFSIVGIGSTTFVLS